MKPKNKPVKGSTWEWWKSERSAPRNVWKQGSMRMSAFVMARKMGVRARAGMPANLPEMGRHGI